MRKLPFILVVLVAALALFSFACGSDSNGSDEPATQDEPATPADGDGPDDDGLSLADREMAREVERAVREVEVALRGMSTRMSILQTSVSRAGGAFGIPDAEERAEDWFSECCDDISGDFNEEAREAERGLERLVELYTEADDGGRLATVERMGLRIGNLRASVSVLEGLPTVDGAPAILEEMSQELLSFSEDLGTLVS